MAVKGKNINVTVNYINSCSHIIGDVYLRKGIKVPNSASSITIQNLYFIDHPAVELSYLWGSNSECPINITGNIFGNANIVPMTSTKEFIKYICGNAVDESFFNISYIGTTIQHIPFEILKIDNCIVTNQTSAKPAESIVICFDGPSNKCPKTYNVLPENDDDWSIYYTPYLTKIEFNMMRDVMIDLSVIKHELSVIFQPYVPIFQVSPGYDVKIASSQRAANYILNWQLGSTTVANVMTITFMNYLSMKNIITIQKSLKYDPKNFKMMLDFYELTYLAIEYMSQINDLSDILPSIPCLIVNSKEIIINIEYTNDGWSIGTSTENYTVNGFYHSNFTLQITKYSSSYKRLVVSVNANNPYLMYLMIEYGSTLSNIVQLAGDWKPFQMICPLILGGTLTLEIPFDFIPINLDDRIQYIFHIIRREIALNITGVYAKNQVMTIYSIVYMNYCQLITFSHSQSEIISIIFMENVDSIRAISSSSSNEIKFIFRKLLIIDNSLVRFWSESSEIKITGEGELLNPTFRDSIVLIWDYLKNDNRWKAPTIKAADSLVRCKFIIQEQKANFSDEDVNQMKHFYFVMAASSDLTLDEFNDKIEFESDSLELKFENRSIKFETFICYMMDFEPDIFTENGIVESENALSLGFYLRRIDDIVENENKTILSQGLSNSQITVISFGVTSFILILVIVIIAIIYRQKNRIDRLLENK
ncbi:hypothetical protein TRFO_03769 [Tritrichomonas foetus]|uniref:Uncharacterized protein n=1 Tax=Tritrichomonas foetus TaxID=1144522 RepID=A0A1J4KMH3_9EUKA|nr:hypothetical protein TRFO_03769 [Tritrichomonas foetus]|eukprot:OHT12128.1 hypothetical protein TRFO_03769 [Tritrichomonas foetus]